MKRIILLVTLFLLACTPPSSEVDVPSDVVPYPLIEEAPQESEEQAPVPEPEPIPPLEVTLTSSNATDQLEITSTLTCTAQGGTPPYTYSWTQDAKELDCNQEVCTHSIKEIGTHEVTCSVADQNTSLSKTTTLVVTKDFRILDELIVLGDSLSQGHGLADHTTQAWPALMAKEFKHASLQKHAVSGATSFHALDPQLVWTSREYNASSYKILVLWIGANDIRFFTPPEQFAINYELLIQNLTKVQNAEFYAATIPDVSKLQITNDVEAGVNSFLNDLGAGVQLNVRGVSQEVVSTYNNIILQIARKHNVKVIDMYSKMETLENDLISDDFFHPNANGHKRIAQEVESHIRADHPTVEFI